MTKEKTEIFHETLGSVKLIGNNTEEMPMWTINHYLRSFCDNYTKLVMIRRMGRLMQMGATGDDICVIRESAPLLADRQYAQRLFEDHERTQIKMLYGDEFWHIVQKYERPVVFARILGDDYEPLYYGFSEEAIKLEQISYHSPISIEPSGIVDSLVDVALAGKRYDMERQEHEARQIAYLADGYEHIARAMQVIEDPRTPEGFKVYARQAMEALMEKQEKLNNKLGIELAAIDIRR